MLHMMDTFTKAAFLSAFLLAYFTVANAQVRKPATPSVPDVDIVLSWLPADTETVVVADMRNGSFLTAKRLKRKENDEDKDVVLPINAVAALFELQPLSFLGLKKPLARLIETHRVALAVEGSRHFRDPKQLGLMPFEGCQVVIFKSALGEAGTRFMRSAAELGLRIEKIGGIGVAVFQEQWEADDWTFYVAFPNANTVLIATNREYMQQVLSRMRTSPADRALPRTLPEWKYVDAHAPFWGMRHYDRSQAELDPSSPFGGKKSANMSDEAAIGLTFYYDPAKGRTPTVIYISADKTAADKFKTYIPSDEEAAKDMQAKFRDLEPGIVESSYQLSKSYSVEYFFFVLGGLLGHAVYL